VTQHSLVGPATVRILGSFARMSAPSPSEPRRLTAEAVLERGGTVLHVFRHGAVAAPWPGRVYGRLDVPLSDEGLDQAAWGARSLEGLELRAVVSSGLPRAEETARLLRGSRGLPRQDRPELLEIDRGAWAGLGPEEIEAQTPGAFAAWQRSGGVLAPPGGETLQVMAGRVVPALTELAELNPGGRVAVAAHMWVVRIAVSMGLDRPLQRAAGIRVGTGARCDLAWSRAEGFRLLGAVAPEGSALTVDGAPL
jgi:broad specificity phosphatase PhoE